MQSDELWTSDKGVRYIEYTIMIESFNERRKLLLENLSKKVNYYNILLDQKILYKNSLDLYKNKLLKIVDIEKYAKAKLLLKTIIQDVGSYEKEIERLKDEINKISKEIERLSILRDLSICKILRFEEYAKRL